VCNTKQGDDVHICVKKQYWFRQTNDFSCVLWQIMKTFKFTYNEIAYNENSVILKILFIPIYHFWYIKSHVILHFSYDGNVSFPLKFIKSGLDCILKKKNSCLFEKCVHLCRCIYLLLLLMNAVQNFTILKG